MVCAPISRACCSIPRLLPFERLKPPLQLVLLLVVNGVPASCRPKIIHNGTTNLEPHLTPGGAAPGAAVAVAAAEAAVAVAELDVLGGAHGGHGMLISLRFGRWRVDASCVRFTYSLRTRSCRRTVVGGDDDLALDRQREDRPTK